MPLFSRLAVLAGVCAAACSLQDFSDLDRCAGQASSSTCPRPGPEGGAPSSAGTAGASAARGGVDVGGSSLLEGGAAGAGYDGAGRAGDGAAAAPSAPSGLRALYAYSPNDPDTPEASKSIRADLAIVNDSPRDVPLAGITLRYYYTSEAAPCSEWSCLSDERDAVVSCDDVSVGFASYSSPSGLANAYFEVTFSTDSAEVLGANGGSSGRLKLSVQKPKFAVQDVTNDYSYDGRMLSLSDWPKVTLQRDGQLLYGTPP